MATKPARSRATSKRVATTPHKAPSRTPKPRAEQAAAVVEAAASAAPQASAGNVVLVSIAKGLRVFHDAAGRRRFIAGGESFEVDKQTAKILLTDDTSFAIAVGLEPTDAGNPERLTMPALTGAITSEDLGKGGRAGAEAEQVQQEAKMAKEAEKAKESSDQPESATPESSPLAPDPVGDEGAAASTTSPLEEAQDKRDEPDEPGATVLS